MHIYAKISYKIHPYLCVGLELLIVDEVVAPTRKKGKGKKVHLNQIANCNT